MRRLMAAFGIAAIAAAAAAGAADVTGTWKMTVEGGPHGTATMGLVLKQEGTKVTGTFASGHAADMPVTGEFVDGTLAIESPGDDGSKVTFTARLKADGTLAGAISSPMGDMKWTASRISDRENGK